MNTFDAIMIAEGEQEADPTAQLEAWQHLIDTGTVWGLQGMFGRQAIRLIELGLCTMPNKGD